ncbi:ComEC/Rec2 family competence protein [Varibaculum vaginae]|uniref:ComEC/Rec2 family competence protein n=1 Tax=Varibaculum vaginae TaxID=2364797 RepID=UPI00135AB9F1|nr:ComEC/Rec2 family competence protein [Varibaculum vaginae]
MSLVIAAALLLGVYYRRLYGVGLTLALALGVFGGVGLSLSQSARQISADPLVRAWQGDISQFRVLAMVENPPRKYAPSSGQQIIQLQLLEARIPGTPKIKTELQVVAFGQRLAPYARGTVLETSLKLEKPHRAAEINPFIYDFASVNTLLDISAQIVATPKVRAGPCGAAALKQKLASRLEEKLVAAKSPAAAALLPAMILGIRADASADTEALKTAGIVHITCVSGMHISVLLSLVALLTSGLQRRWRLAACGSLLIGYCLLLGPAPSLLRAALMGMVSILALTRGREPSSFSSLQTAVIGLLIFEPSFGQDAGFLLSVSATAAIVLFAKPFEAKLQENLKSFERKGSWLILRVASEKCRSRLEKFLVAFLTVSAVSLIAQIACLPGQLFIRPGISTLTVLANVAIAPVVTLLIWGGACLTFLPLPGTLLAKILGIGCSWVMMVAHGVAANRLAVLPWPQGIPGILALSAVACGASFIFRCYFAKTGIGGNVEVWPPSR